MLHNKAGWVGRMLLSVTALVIVSCGNSQLDVASGPHSSANAAPAVSGGTRRASHVAGQFLARASITATHTVEFWEIKPGSVVMVQLIKPGGTDKSLDLGPMLLKAGGTYGGLYRKLLNDPNATLSPELVAADERRSHSPIRDASLPLPKRPAPPHTPRTHGTPAAVPSQASMQPGTLRTQSTYVDGGDVYDNSGITDFDCNAPEVEGSWCPPGAYNDYIYGESDEVIYYDVAGYNPQSYPSDDGYENDDTFYLEEYDPTNPAAGWVQELGDAGWDLWPGETLRLTFAGSPAQYYGEVDGNVVAFADRYRLSFPSLSYVYNDPDWSDKGTFSNDIEGIAHAQCPGPIGCDPELWFFSRTEQVAGHSGHGQIGISGDLGGVAYDCTYDEPGWGPVGGPVGGDPAVYNWYSGGGPAGSSVYAHYGDIVYEPNTLRAGNQGFLTVSLNAANNTMAGLGFLGVVPTPRNQCKYTLQNWGTIQLSPGEQAPCVAKTNKYLYHYVDDTYYEDLNDVHVYVPSSASWNALHEYLINISSTPVPPAVRVQPTLVWSQDISIVNANWQTYAEIVGSPNGLKVSSHGKLYMWGVATASETGRLYGIDPFSGMIETQYDINYGSPGTQWPKIESEGLDIIDDAGLVRSPSDAPFQGTGFLLQMLADAPIEAVYDSRWAGAVLSADDPSRL